MPCILSIHEAHFVIKYLNTSKFIFLNLFFIFNTQSQMCGILAFFDRNGHYKGTPEELKKLLVELSYRQTTRGPDGSGHVGGAHWGLAHERLAIMDPEGG